MSEPVSVTAPTEDIETGVVPEPETGKGVLKPVSETTPIERCFAVLAIITAIVAVASMIVEMFGTVFIITGVLSCAMGAYSYQQQTLLTDIRTLKETEEALRAQVDRLQAENLRLAKNIDDMKGSLDELDDIEDALEEITKLQGQNVEMFEKQIEENKKILQSMEMDVQTQVLNNLQDVLDKCDEDGDMIIDEEEVDKILKSMDSIPGVDVVEERFRAAFTGKDQGAAIKVIQNLFDENIPEEERIFLFRNDNE